MGQEAFRQGMAFGAFHVVIVVLYILIFVIPVWKIVSKAGYSGAWSLLVVIPVLNIIVLWVFAFSRWPIIDRA